MQRNLIIIQSHWINEAYQIMSYYQSILSLKKNPSGKKASYCQEKRDFVNKLRNRISYIDMLNISSQEIFEELA